MELVWADRISKAEKIKAFTQDDMLAANGWCGCVVGERIDFKSQHRTIYDLSLEAIQLGHNFSIYVLHNDIRNAKRIYEAIMKLESVLE